LEQAPAPNEAKMREKKRNIPILPRLADIEMSMKALHDAPDDLWNKAQLKRLKQAYFH